jgi:hypothetical protein
MGTFNCIARVTVRLMVEVQERRKCFSRLKSLTTPQFMRSVFGGGISVGQLSYSFRQHLVPPNRVAGCLMGIVILPLSFGSATSCAYFWASRQRQRGLSIHASLFLLLLFASFAFAHPWPWPIPAPPHFTSVPSPGEAACIQSASYMCSRSFILATFSSLHRVSFQLEDPSFVGSFLHTFPLSRNLASWGFIFPFPIRFIPSPAARGTIIFRPFLFFTQCIYVTSLSLHFISS